MTDILRSGPSTDDQGTRPAGEGDVETDGGVTVGDPEVVSTDPSEGVPDDAPAPPKGRRRGPNRTAVLVFLGGLVALVVADMILGSVAHEQRQQHLISGYGEPKARIDVGDATFVLQAPAIGLNEAVVFGATNDLLRGGPGQRPDSAPPGTGNTVVMGRSERFGHPFGQIGELAAGDKVALRTRDGRTYTYKVTKVRTVSSDDNEILDPSGPTRLTLVTSAGGPLDGSKRVVIAAADGAQPKVPAAVSRAARTIKKGEPGPFDERSAGSALLLVAGLVAAGAGVLGAVELRRRYAPVTVVAVAGPAIALGVVLVLFNIDVFLPITF